MNKICALVVLAFVVPVMGYFVVRGWGALVSKVFGMLPSDKLRRTATTFILLMPIFTIASFVRFDYDELRSWWVRNPYAVSALGAGLLVLVPISLVFAIVRVWRKQQRPFVAR